MEPRLFLPSSQVLLQVILTLLPLVRGDGWLGQARPGRLFWNQVGKCFVNVCFAQDNTLIIERFLFINVLLFFYIFVFFLPTLIGFSNLQILVIKMKEEQDSVKIEKDHCVFCEKYFSSNWIVFSIVKYWVCCIVWHTRTDLGMKIYLLFRLCKCDEQTWHTIDTLSKPTTIQRQGYNSFIILLYIFF